MTLQIFAGTLAALVVAMAYVFWRAEQIRKKEKLEAEELAKREALSGMNAARAEQELLNEEQREFNKRVAEKIRDIPIGKRVKYRLTDGSDVMVEIKTERMKHEEGHWGWEGIFEDDGQLGFVDERRVVASGEAGLT